jgi:hypothetical protein
MCTAGDYGDYGWGVVAAMPPGLNAWGIRGPRGGGMQPVRDELNLDVVVLRAATISNKVA